MDRKGNGSKTVYCSTEDGVTTRIQIHHNPKTDHIGFGSATFQKSSGNSGSSKTNKECSAFLGVHVAEGVLSKIFQNVTRMRNGNPGYDFLCSKGYRIDVKSATKMKSCNSWQFNINKNRIADYFLCLAFDNRENLNPEHLWLIPAAIVNNKKGVTISPSTLEKWQEYELDSRLNDVIACCTTLKGD